MPCGLACFVLWLTSLISVRSPSTSVTTDAGAPIVDLGYAQYQGHYDAQTNITSFLSVRYAAPPLENLRFQAPQSPLRESGVQLATQNPNMCYQSEFGANPNLTSSDSPHKYDKRASAGLASSEDCLFLNVFVPGAIPSEPATTTDGLPVVVWIHGGGYAFGFAAEYNGVSLVVDSLNTAIVVVIQYRLGAFGFLSGNEVKAHGALNAGLLDQAFALQWVQDHIGLFGGDKTRVTIWGESAGGGSVVQHMVAHGGNTRPPLFNGAIVSSTALLSQYDYNHRVPQSLYDRVVALTGCASSADTFECLQSVDAETLETANQDVVRSAFYGTFAFIPVVDGTFIVERPTVTLARGRVNGHVLLAVSNENEGKYFMDANETLTITEYISRLFPDMTSLEIAKAAAVYEGHGSALEQATLAVGESTIICPTYYLLRTFTGRSWKGLFAIPPANHADDLRYYLSRHPPPYDNQEFITAFSHAFMSVAKYGNVNVKFDPSNITPYWNSYRVGRTEMLFNRTEAGAPVVKPIVTDPGLLRRCAFWSSVTSATAQ